MADDFNVIRFLSEHNSGGRLSCSMRRFFEALEDLELRNLPLPGGLFTWFEGPNS